MDIRATKTPYERQQEEDERLVRPNPSDKPPRRDRRRERVQPETDPDTDDSSDKKDRSRNYKNVGGSLRDRLVQRFAAGDRIPAKNRETGETVLISPDTLKEQPGKYEPVEREEKTDQGPSEGEPKAKQPPKKKRKGFPGSDSEPKWTPLENAKLKGPGEEAKPPEQPAEKPEPAKSEPAEKPEEKPDPEPSKQEGPEQEAPKPQPTATQKAGIPDPKRRPVNAAEREEALSILVDTFPPHISAELIAKDMHPDDVKTLVRDYMAAKTVDSKRIDDVVAKASTFFETDPTRVKPPLSGKNASGEEVPFDDLTPDEQAEAARAHQLRVTAMSLAAQELLTDKLAGKGKLTGRPRIPKSLASTLANVILSNVPSDKSFGVAADVFDTVLQQGTAQDISDKSARELLSSVKKHPVAHAVAKAYLQANDYGLAKQKFLKGDDESISEWQSPGALLKGLRKAGEFFDARNATYGSEGTVHPSATFFRSRVMGRLRNLDPRKARVVAAHLPQLEEKEYKARHQKWEARHREWEARRKAHAQQMEAYARNPRGNPPGEFVEDEPIEPQPPMNRPSKETGASMWDAPTGEKPPAKEPSKDPEMAFDEADRKEVAQAAADAVKNPPKLNKEASVSTYPVAPVMGSARRIAIYHGINPYAYGPQAYPGWLQAHQRDLGEADFQIILGKAGDWLKSPLLSVAVDGMLPDARFRAALDLAIYDGPYNRAVNATQYNQLLAKLAKSPDSVDGSAIQSKTAGHSYEVAKMTLLIYGKHPYNVDVADAIRGARFEYTDDEGEGQEDGHANVRDHKSSKSPTHVEEKQKMVAETVVTVDFPKGAEKAALKAIQDALKPLKLKVEKTEPSRKPELRKLASDDSFFSSPPSDSVVGGILSMKASKEIRRFAAEAATTNPKLSYEMLAFADKLAEEEKKMPPWLKDKVDDKKDDEGKKDEGKEQQKEASSSKYATLRTLIIKQASSVAPQQRALFRPILQALKDLG